MAEEPDALFVSDEGEVRWLPEYAEAEEVLEPVHPGRPWRWEADGPHLDPQWQRWRRVKLTPPLQDSIRRLLRERDEARENVRLLMEMVATLPPETPSGVLMSEKLRGLWDRYYGLYRQLREQDWFRERDGL